MSESMNRSSEDNGAVPQPVASRLMRGLVGAMGRLVLLVFSPLLQPPTSERPRRGRTRLRAIVAASEDPAVRPPTEGDGGCGLLANTPPVVIPVPPAFGPHDYGALFEALAAPGPKLLDLSSVKAIRADLFEVLVAGWQAEPGSVPRLGFLLSFYDWTRLRELAAPQLSALGSRGVVAALFYEEQAYDGLLIPWFSHGEVVHNLAGVIATLRTRLHVSPIAPAVLDAVTSLLFRDDAGSSCAQFIDVARIALSFGANAKACSLARAALRRLDVEAGAARFEALNVLGHALMADDRVIAATVVLEDGIRTAVAIGSTEAAAEMLHYLGLCELNRGDAADAEGRFLAAIDLLRPPRSELLAAVHHNLALSLLCQGKDTAEVHAGMALACRANKNSLGARMDCELLVRIRNDRELAS